MKLKDIITEPSNTYTVDVNIVGGEKLTLTITDRFTKAWNQAQLTFNRALFANHGKEDVAELNAQAESKLYASLVVGWTLEDELSEQAIIELFTFYPIIKHEIELFLLMKESEMQAQKKSLSKLRQKGSKAKS